MITIRADNRALLEMNEQFSYLAANYSSGVTSIIITNSVGLSVGDPVLIGQFGSETGETAYISGVETETHTITFENPLKFAHSESTKVSKLRYSMIEFLWGDGPDYDALTSTTSQDIPQLLGDSTTEWDITVSSGRTTYTYTGTGTEPRISDYFAYPFPSAGSFTQRAWIDSPNFNSANNVTTQSGAEMYEIGEDFFTIVNAGSSESGVTTGAGYVKLESQYIDIMSDQFYTIYRDNVNITGFAFFRWWNPRSHVGTIVKSPVPYAGFPDNCAKTILDDFFSTLNNKELKLITRADAFRWLSEGYSVVLNELNIVNREFGVTDTLTITTVIGQQEYALPRPFSKVISLNGGDNGLETGAITQEAVAAAASNNGTTAYYLRGTRDLEQVDVNLGVNSEVFLGFSPTPDSVTTYTLRYLVKGVRLTKNYDAVYLPNNEFYCLKDYMMFRASPKLNRGDGSNFFQLFTTSVQRMKMTSHKQNNHRDSFGIEPWANV